MRKIVLLILLSLIVFHVSPVLALELEPFQLEIFEMLKIKNAFSNVSHEPLEEVLPVAILCQEELPDLKKFVRENFKNPCVTRTTYPFHKETFVQVFRDASSVEKFMPLDQKIRDPRWAPGVSGIIEFSGNKLIKAEKFVRRDGDRVVTEDLLARRIHKDKNATVYRDKN